MDDELPPRLLTPAEVARIFSVQSKTVSRWAATGALPCIRTLGNHRRFKESDVRRFFDLRQEQSAR